MELSGFVRFRAKGSRFMADGRVVGCIGFKGWTKLLFKGLGPILFEKAQRVLDLL